MVELFVAAEVFLAGSMNGNPAAVGGHVGVAVNKEGNNHNGKRTRQAFLPEGVVLCRRSVVLLI